MTGERVVEGDPPESTQAGDAVPLVAESPAKGSDAEGPPNAGAPGAEPSGVDEADARAGAAVEQPDPAVPAPAPESRSDAAPSHGFTAALYKLASDVARPVAALTLAAATYDRAVAPSLRGIAVGYDTFTNRAGFVAEVVALALLLTLVVAGFVQSLALINSRVHLAVRIPALFFGGFTLLVAFGAVFLPRPPIILLVVASGASALVAVLVGATLLRRRHEQGVAAAAIIAALATALRMAAVFIADRAATQPRTEGPELARLLATGAFGLECLVLAVATVWIAARNRRFALPAVLVAIGIAFFVTRWVVVDGSDTHPLAVILRVGARGMLSRPVPLVPYYAEVFVAFLGPLLALAALVIPKEVSATMGALAIVLIVRGSGEIPLHAAAMAIACGSLMLAAYDSRAIWARVDSLRTRR